MDSYKVMLFLHILVVVVAVGVTFSYPFLQAFAEREGVGPTRFVLRVTKRLDNFLILPGSLLIFVFGLGLIFDDVTGYSDDFPAWLMVAIAWYLLAVGVAFFVQRRNVDQAIAVLEGEPDSAALPEAYAPVGKRMQLVGGLLGLSVIGIAFLMVWKPGQ